MWHPAISARGARTDGARSAMRVTRFGIGRISARVLPASVLSVAVLTGLGGSLQPVHQIGDPAQGATADNAATQSTPVPETALEAPASVSLPGRNTDPLDQIKLAGATTVADIPTAALSAYQRAAS